MAYKVVKTIKGRKYLYLQSTYREGNKVKTISQYIGAVSAETGGVITPSDDPDEQRPTDTAEQVEAVLVPEPQKVEPKQKPPKKKAKVQPKKEVLTLQKPVFKIRAYRISQNALTNEHKRNTNKLKRYGVDPAYSPKITLRYGKKYGYHKPAFSDGLTVTVEREKHGREKIRKEYRKALHRGFIETLERQAPEKIAPFRYAFDSAYRDTQNALNSYLMNSNSKGSFARVLALKFFSVMNPVPAGKRKLAPEKLGLVSYGKRKDWKADYCEMMAEIDKKGIDKLTARAKKEIAIANNQQRKAIKKRTIFFIRKRKTVKRLQARIDANKAMLRKLDLVKRFKLS